MNKVLVRGKATGTVLKSGKPINFLGTVDKKTGTITDRNHDLFQAHIKDVILAFPHGIGSSVGAYTIYSIKQNDAAPAAMICTRADLTVVTGCAAAGIPCLITSKEEFASIKTGQQVSLDTESQNPITILG